MSTFKSMTGRTVVEATVAPAGDVEIFVRRNGQTINSFSVGREADIPKSAALEADSKRNVVSVIVDAKEVDAIPIV